MLFEECGCIFLKLFEIDFFNVDLFFYYGKVNECLLLKVFEILEWLWVSCIGNFVGIEIVVGFGVSEYMVLC